MIKYFGLIKDFFMVYDELKDSGYRPSEAMIVNAVLLVSSALVIIFGVDLQLTDVESYAIAGAIFSFINIIVRFRSKGGQSKLKKETK